MGPQGRGKVTGSRAMRAGGFDAEDPAVGLLGPFPGIESRPLASMHGCLAGPNMHGTRNRPHRAAFQGVRLLQPLSVLVVSNG
jgi:hypothetical protein